ncbi:hypothetical protein BJ878DRAFT_455201 [Calycina marina]|uniref:Signal recognition particle subunit SRP72 n=1 Tax=Calycina marina TaxID=1763456 RepID=A0A9P7Z806_9HELO|nr:hypothetical protein BJ878DRAFT_455201 [Calycina marina]
MSSNPTATLTSLLRGSTIEDHEEVLKAANAVLKTSKTPEAYQTRVVALLKLDRFDDALRALDDGGNKLAERCVLEKAYALYKTGKLEEAEGLVEGREGRGLKHVAAQVAYRAEKFEDAASIYRELSAETGPIEGEDNDLKINSSATDAQLEWQGNGDKVEKSRKEAKREDMEAFETAYNAACGAIARGDLAKGGYLLKTARGLCEALDELTDKEKRTEVLPILLQQAFVFTKLGKLEDAEKIQNSIDVVDVPEAPTRVIAQNNALAAHKNDNPYMTQRIFDSVPKLSHTERLFEHQSSILRRNRYVIDLQSQKFSGVAQSTASIILKSPSPTISPFINSLAVLNAAGHSHGEAGKASLKQVLPQIEKRPNDVGLLLTTIQLYVLTNNSGRAIELLEAFFKRLEESNTPADLDVRYAPGLIALAVSLYRLSGRKVPTRTELGKVASYWRRKSKSSSTSLLRAAGLSLLDSSNPDDFSAAGEIFSSLREQDQTDKVAIAGYVASYAAADYEKISADLDKLTPVAKLISGIDAAELEEAGMPTLPATKFAVTGKKRSVENDASDNKPAKRKKIPKSKMPKDFDEGKKLDAERWLPLRDRSSYRPKGKKGKKKVLDMTQGGAVKEEESLELAGGVGTVKVEKSGSVVKNKKKKGKK